MLKRCLIYLVLFVSFSALNAETTILCLGDSLTAGYGLTKDQAYPALLQQQLKSKGKFKVINAGVSGNTSAGGLRRVDWYFKNKIDFLILALGANDGLRGLNPKDTQDNLEKIIIKARQHNKDIKILIAGMKVPPNMGKDYSESFEKIFPALAQKNKCSLIPFLLENVGGIAKMNLPDGIHPNEAGQKELAKNILKILLPELNK